MNKYKFKLKLQGKAKLFQIEAAALIFCYIFNTLGASIQEILGDVSDNKKTTTKILRP